MKIALTLFLVSALLAGCSTFKSQFDKVELVWKYSDPIEHAKTPAGFVITPQEIKEIIPLTKYAWNIYADEENYYLSSAIQKLSSKTGDNSHLAKKNGIKIKGTNRDTLEEIKKDMDARGIRMIDSGRLLELTRTQE